MIRSEKNTFPKILALLAGGGGVGLLGLDHQFLTSN